MKKIISIFFILFTIQISFAQQSLRLQGNIIDSKTSEPIPFASVFLEGTTYGTQTDSVGNFIIRNIVSGNYRLVVSMIGYKTVVQSVILEKLTNRMSINLVEDNTLLNEVKIVGNKDTEWEKNYKTFEKTFLGENYNKKEVRILNKEVIDFQFDKEKKVLKATANQPLIIENKTLGYKLTYILQDFGLDNKTISYRGLTHFEFLSTENNKDYWQKNRLKAYRGSVNHFLKALMSNNLKNEGFEAYYLNTNYVNLTGKSPLFYDMGNGRHFPVNPLEFESSSPKSWRNISIKFPIEVVYTKKTITKPAFQDAPYPYSILIQKEKTSVNENGFIDNPYAIELKGDMGIKGMADLLPNNYSEEGKIEEQNEEQNDRKLQQSIYVHTNKEQYHNRETIWFKSYLVDNQYNHFLDSPQKIYIELFSLTDFKTPLIQHIYKTKETSIAYGSIQLPDLPSGDYLLRAYSNAMRNDFDNVSIFEKSIYVENPKSEYALVEVKDKNERLYTKDSSITDLNPKLFLHDKGGETFSLSLSNSIGGEFSMSVIEENKERASSSTIKEYFEMTSKKRTEKVVSNTNKNVVPAYEPLRIEGKLLDEKKKIIPNASIIAVGLNGTQQPISTKTDAKGMFSFDSIEFEDSSSFLVKVTIEGERK